MSIGNEKTIKTKHIVSEEMQAKKNYSPGEIVVILSKGVPAACKVESVEFIEKTRRYEITLTE